MCPVKENIAVTTKMCSFSMKRHLLTAKMSTYGCIKFLMTRDVTTCTAILYTVCDLQNQKNIVQLHDIVMQRSQQKK